MSADKQGAPEAAWASGDTLREFRQETARLPGTALKGVVKLIDGVADSLLKLEVHAGELREQRDQEAKLRANTTRLWEESLRKLEARDERIKELSNQVRRLQREVRAKTRRAKR